MRAPRLQEIVMWTLLGCLMSILGIVCWQLFYPYQPIRVDEIKIFQKELQRGDELTFQFIGEKLMDIPVHATVELENGERIAAITYSSHNPVGTLFRKRTFIVPSHTVPGKYRIKWTGVYEVNPLRSITVVKHSDWITVK